jgi:hypothetical protein
MTRMESTFLWGFCVFAPSLMVIGLGVCFLLSPTRDLDSGALLPLMFVIMIGAVTRDMLVKLDKRILDLEKQLNKKEATN